MHQTPRTEPMPSRRKQPATNEPCGSGQSAASLAADKAAQPRLLAAAAARKAIAKDKKSSTPSKKLLDLKSLVSSASPASSTSKKAYKDDKAVFTLVKARATRRVT